MIKFLNLYHQYLSIQSEIDQVIRSTIEQSAYIGGAALKEFETAFADYQQAKHCVGVGNGTDALERDRSVGTSYWFRNYCSVQFFYFEL